MKRNLFFSFFALLVFALAATAQDRGNAQAAVKGKTIKINYGRPSLQGRDMLGMARVGNVWRLGMNEATEIESTGTLTVGGKDLKPGKYSLWAKKTGENQWILGFHPSTGIWGQPEMTSGYVAEMPLTFTKAPTAADQLTINVAERAGNAAITIHWGTAQLTGTFGVK